MSRRALGILALAFALAHAAFLAPSLEDIDSVNFALGVRDFDVAEHRPHPPGYPVHIALGKVAVAAANLFDSDATPRSSVEARALSVLSLIGSLAAMVVLYGFLHALTGSEVRALAATALTASSPLFWYLAVRPMSDGPGLAAALAALWCLALAWQRQRSSDAIARRLAPAEIEASGRMIVLGALLTGMAIGFRSQNAVLTVPFLIGVLLDRIGRGAAGALIGGSIALAVGVLLWAVPLVAASGGVNAYLAALGSQAGEDFAGVEMLYLNPGNTRLAAFAIVHTLIYPWDSIALGAVVVIAAVVGALWLLVRDRRTLAAVLLIGVPYLTFHLLFHDTRFVRYALPLVPIVVLAAVIGLEVVARRAALPMVGGLALWGVTIAVPTLAGYAAEASPTVRALDHLGARASGGVGAPVVLAMHQTFRRPLEAEDVRVASVLPSPPRREWLELAKYWREGHTAPVFFLADPSRTDLALIDPQSRTDRVDFMWRWSSLSDLGGMRPRAVHLYRLPAPGWFVEQGWALTPETAGIARLMAKSPSFDPIQAWVRRRPDAIDVLVGGRHLGTVEQPPVTFAMSLAGKEVARWDAAPGFFLRHVALPAGVVEGDGLALLTIQAISGQGGSIDTAIEQFDLQSSGTLMWGYDNGWHEAEYTQTLGSWRWASDRATLRIINATRAVAVTLRVESPSRYFADPPTVRMRAGEQTIAETSFTDSNVWRVVVPLAALQDGDGRVSIETNRTFVPADTSDVRDQRRLGLRVFDVDVAFEH